MKKTCENQKRKKKEKNGIQKNLRNPIEKHKKDRKAMNQKE